VSALLLCLSALFSASTAANESAVATRLDGELNDAAWQSATPISDFRQQDPLNGEPATERTEVRIVDDAPVEDEPTDYEVGTVETEDGVLNAAFSKTQPGREELR